MMGVIQSIAKQKYATYFGVRRKEVKELKFKNLFGKY
jgi:hypothetical protein